MRRSLFILVIISLTIESWSQTIIQQGIVKTKGRMVNSKYIPGKGLEDATVIIQGRSAVLTQANGSFSFPIIAKTFMIQEVLKNGYQLVDADATKKDYQYTPNTFYILMETPEQQMEDKLATEQKIRRMLQLRLQKREDELEKLKVQNKLTQEDYCKALQQLYDEQKSNEMLIADMAKEYSQMDYDQMDSLNRQISNDILNGELTKADSLLRSKGDMRSRNEEISRRKKAEVQRKNELARQQKELDISEEGTRKLLEDFAADCYKFYKIYQLENKYDSASYYIELRANRDTTNAIWQYDAGSFFFYYAEDYQKATPYYLRLLKLLNLTNNFGNNNNRTLSQIRKIMRKNSSLDISPVMMSYILGIHVCIGYCYYQIGNKYECQGDTLSALNYFENFFQVLNEKSKNINYPIFYLNIFSPFFNYFEKAIDYYTPYTDFVVSLLAKDKRAFFIHFLLVKLVKNDIQNPLTISRCYKKTLNIYRKQRRYKEHDKIYKAYKNLIDLIPEN